MEWLLATPWLCIFEASENESTLTDAYIDLINATLSQNSTLRKKVSDSVGIPEGSMLVSNLNSVSNSTANLPVLRSTDQNK